MNNNCIEKSTIYSYDKSLNGKQKFIYDQDGNEIVREKIKFPNIPYFGMISDNVGYINLMQFNPQSENEVKTAFNKLKSDNDLQGIVLELRGNGGGLLA